MTESLTASPPEGQISERDKRRKGVDVDSTPLGDSLRLLAANCLSSGQKERAAGIMIAADVVEGQLASLSGGSLVKALDRMIEIRLSKWRDEVVADVVAALRDDEPLPRANESAATETIRDFTAIVGATSPAFEVRAARASRPSSPPAGPRVVSSSLLQGMGKGPIQLLVAIAQHEDAGPKARGYIERTGSTHYQASALLFGASKRTRRG